MTLAPGPECCSCSLARERRGRLLPGVGAASWQETERRWAATVQTLETGHDDVVNNREASQSRQPGAVPDKVARELRARSAGPLQLFPTSSARFHCSSVLLGRTGREEACLTMTLSVCESAEEGAASSPPSLCSSFSPRTLLDPLAASRYARTSHASSPSEPPRPSICPLAAARFAPPRLPGREPVNVLPRFDESRLLLRSVQRGGERSDPTVEDRPGSARPGRLPVGVRLRHDEPCDGFLLLLTEYAQLS